MAQAALSHGNPIMVGYTPGSAVTAGDVVVQNDLVCIAHDAIAANRRGEVAAVGGVYRVTADAAIVVGKKVYWDDTANKITETSTGNKVFGMNVEASSADGDVIQAVHMPGA